MIAPRMSLMIGLVAFMFALLGHPAVAQGLPTPTPSKPVEVRGASHWDFTSHITGRTYRVFLAVPDGPAPDEGFVAIYVLDGNSSFLTARDAVRAQSAFAEIRPAVVVGIGYPSEDGMEILKTRNKDLTTPITQEVLSRMPPNPGLSVENTGGVDDFLRVIELEIKPLVAKMAPVNPKDQSLVGHSLGGLTVVRALFTEPDAFRTFVASSPSLFWNDTAVLKDEAQFMRRLSEGRIAPRVMIAVGALEGDRLLFRTGAAPMTQAEVDETIATVRMVANARGLGERLAQAKGPAGYHARSVVFEGESHLSVIPAVISRAVSFALSVDGDGPPARKPAAN